MTSLTDREKLMTSVTASLEGGARKSAACAAIDLQVRTLERWERQTLGDKRSLIEKEPANKLTGAERSEVLRICCSDEFKDMTPNEIVPRMAETGRFIASEASIYRILKAEGMVKKSNSRKTSRRRKPTALTASGPCQVWSWDITYLRSSVKGLYFYLYLIQDVWSRAIVGWAVHETESADHAADLMKKISAEMNIKNVKLHADNGGPMKGATMLATLQRLGVIPSFSRPSVSNDNPYSESLFKTLKYRASYPDHFASVEHAHEWVTGFVAWYNHEHLHSGIKFVTPMQRHRGADKKILENRKETYEKARLKNPQRWVGGIRNWNWQAQVTLNPDKKPDLTMDKAA
jgi:transposase InsO family protein